MELQQFLTEPELIFESETANTYIYKCIPVDFPKQQPYILKCINHNEKKPNKCVKQCRLLENEFKISQKFSQNTEEILQQQEFQKNTSFKNKNCCTVKMELAELGDFFAASKGENKETHKNLQKMSNFKKVFLQCAKSLQIVHKQGVSHNDIKEDNFFVYSLDFDNQDLKVKLGDFGFAFEGQRTLEQQFNLYKPKNQATLSPEQIEIVNKIRKVSIDEKKSDIYCLGIVMLETFLRVNFAQVQEDAKLQEWIDTGSVSRFQCKFPKYFRQLKEVNEDVKENIEMLKIIFGALNSNPEKRVSIETLIEKLEQEKINVQA